ncbi:MAG: hypothetical protein PHH13_01360 [Candidatus Peribacteraceae bacterium]|nr:hypothetical protein [Candidatus Peribacteraceae bacterium]
MTRADELQKVQELYLMQIELWKVLDEDMSSAAALRQAREQLKTFAALLKQVSWEHMGGEDVYMTLQQMCEEAGQKLSHAPVRALAKKPTVVKRTVMRSTQTKGKKGKKC